GGCEPFTRKRMARPEGIEPPAYRFEACRSIQLSYGRAIQVVSGFGRALSVAYFSSDRHGQPHCKRAARIGRARHFDLAAVRLDDAAGNREPEPDAADAPDVAAPPERLEDSRAIRRRDADAMIGY